VTKEKPAFRIVMLRQVLMCRTNRIFESIVGSLVNKVSRLSLDNKLGAEMQRAYHKIGRSTGLAAF
jgi:hypothetical protein